MGSGIYTPQSVTMFLDMQRDGRLRSDFKYDRFIIAGEQAMERFLNYFGFDPIAYGFAIQVFQNWDEMLELYCQEWYNVSFMSERVGVLTSEGLIFADRLVMNKPAILE